MDIRKGPYGQFAILKLDEGMVVSEYAVEMIRNDITGCALPVYLNDTSFGRELAFDCTGMIKLSDTDSAVNIKRSRNAIAELFDAIADLSDKLLSPGNMIWDTDWLFLDKENNKLKLCINPAQTSEDKLKLSSLDDSATQSFLSHPFFGKVLTSQERDSLLYAIRDNDEELLRQAAENIRNYPVDIRSFPTGKIPKGMIATAAVALISLAFMSFGEIFLSFLFFIFSCFLLIPCILKTKHGRSGRDEESSYDKTRILFESEKNRTGTITCLMLSYNDNGQQYTKAIYTTRATLGSDCFLSDITIDTPDISPLHLEIIRNKDGFGIIDRSDDNSSYLDNIRLEPEKPYEIRDGQTVICGRTEIRISLGLR